ncbi:MAG TPA: glycoside hydrolase family 43 protein, partial [Chloroflexia bacterium]|nr:glycoside hydrolase family 43 protein [Chloroflexia bacterium]
QFANPVLDQDFPDPDVLHVGDTYYAYATNANSINIQVARSTNLVEWRILADALPVLPPWASPGNTWAPEVTTTTTGSYVMYFAARQAGGRFQCIGVATSTEPQGPFRSRATEPLICPLDEGGAIDPSSFTDDDGTRYVLWKNDGNCCGDATHLYLQKVSGDGLTLDGPPTALVENDQTWEADVVEAPTLVKHGGKYYLFYSANAYNTERYSVGYAEADSITGPYRKATDPLLRSRLTRPPVVGPGGQDVVLDLKGRTWMLYHAWDSTISYRTLNLDPLNWEGDKPVVQGPTRGPEQAP